MRENIEPESKRNWRDGIMGVMTWTDASSLTLVLLDSIRQNQAINLSDIMYRFALLQNHSFGISYQEHSVQRLCRENYLSWNSSPDRSKRIKPK